MVDKDLICSGIINESMSKPDDPCLINIRKGIFLFLLVNGTAITRSAAPLLNLSLEIIKHGQVLACSRPYKFYLNQKLC